MTNEEAICALEHIRSVIRNGIMPTKPGRAIEACDIAISALSRDRWISVEERLPDANVRVLACVNILGKPSVWDAVRWNGKNWEAEEEPVYDYWTTIDHPVTHWRPLPEPPKEDKP